MDNLPTMAALTNTANKTIIIVYFCFKSLPLLVSTLSIYLGYRLFILGVTGQASLSIQSKTVSGQLLNAAPGLFFAVGGIVTMIVVVWKGVKVSFGPPQDRTDVQLFNVPPKNLLPADSSRIV